MFLRLLGKVPVPAEPFAFMLVMSFPVGPLTFFVAVVHILAPTAELAIGWKWYVVSVPSTAVHADFIYLDHGVYAICSDEGSSPSSRCRKIFMDLVVMRL